MTSSISWDLSPCIPVRCTALLAACFVLVSCSLLADLEDEDNISSETSAA
jgi:hypothetical protein